MYHCANAVDTRSALPLLCQLARAPQKKAIQNEAMLHSSANGAGTTTQGYLKAIRSGPFQQRAPQQKAIQSPFAVGPFNSGLCKQHIAIALFVFKMAQHLDSGFEMCFAPSTFGAGVSTKTRCESSKQ